MRVFLLSSPRWAQKTNGEMQQMFYIILTALRVKNEWEKSNEL